MDLLLMLAQGQAQPQCGGGGGLQMIVTLVLMFGVFYLILIRPQQKRAKAHQNLLNNLKKGDQVITRGGIVGRISGVADNVVTLEVQEKVRMRVLKGYIEGTFQDGVAKVTAPTKSEAPTQTT